MKALLDNQQGEITTTITNEITNKRKNKITNEITNKINFIKMFIE